MTWYFKNFSYDCIPLHYPYKCLDRTREQKDMEIKIKSRRFLPNTITVIYVLVLFITIAPPKVLCREERPNSEKYLKAVQNFADTVIEKGRDTYGSKHTPLFVDGLHVKSLKPVIWKKDGQSWLLSNFASQQPLIRTLDGLSALTMDTKYRRAD